jgi:hypothetical protein
VVFFHEVHQSEIQDRIGAVIWYDLDLKWRIQIHQSGMPENATLALVYPGGTPIIV